MDRKLYFDRLYPLQDEVLRLINAEDAEFYLTGGTAASRGYLHHRFSDDLDLFTNDADEFSIWSDRVIQALLRSDKWHLTVEQRDRRFVRCVLAMGDLAM